LGTDYTIHCRSDDDDDDANDCLQIGYDGFFARQQMHQKLTTRTTTTITTTTKQSAKKSILLEIPTPEDMQDIGALLSLNTGPLDTILMDGDLGAGKTCFSRGFVRARSGRHDERVTSPTYLLSNTYPTPDGVLIHHIDLYRLTGEGDLGLLNMDHVLQQCISLIEWPSRLGKLVPETRLDLTFSIREDVAGEEEGDDSKTRILRVKPHGVQWEKRLDFLVKEGYIDDLLIEEEEENETK
jgi:tRNA threonylcarbamoyl adenosine modification protein YjeE